MIQTLVDNGTIRLGYVSDNEAAVIQFPIANAVALFGSGGTWYLLNRRPEDEDAYAVPTDQVEVDDNFVYWTLKAYDVAQYGNGECQLQYRVGDTVKMSQKWRTAVCSSLVDGGEVPTPYETWLDQLADYAETAEEAADRAEAAVTHAPYIGDNGNWWVWDTATSAYVDTGVSASGSAEPPVILEAIEQSTDYYEIYLEDGTDISQAEIIEQYEDGASFVIKGTTGIATEGTIYVPLTVVNDISGIYGDKAYAFDSAFYSMSGELTQNAETAAYVMSLTCVEGSSATPTLKIARAPRPFTSGYATASAKNELSTAGAKGWQWSSASQVSAAGSVDFTLIGSVSQIAVGDRVSCKAGYSWNFCGTVMAISGQVVTVTVELPVPTAGVDGVTTTWSPADYAEVGYLWLIDKPYAGNYAIGDGAFATGYYTKANEMGAIASGESSIADGRYSAAFGTENEVGYASIATGKKNKAYGYYSLAHGHSNTVKGGWSSAFGYNNIINRLYCFVTGHDNKVYSNTGTAVGASNTLGSETTQNIANNSFVFGQNNTLIKGVASIVGGNANTVGTETYGSGQSLVIGSQNTVASTANSHFAIVSGQSNTVNSSQAVALGFENNVTGAGGVGIGGTSVTSGSAFRGNTVSGAGAVAIGSGNTASNVGSVAVGLGNTAGGHGTLASGKSNNVTGAQALVGGYSNTVSGSQSFASGASNSVTGARSAAIGNHLTTATADQAVVGKYNATNTSARFIVGNGTSDSARSNALVVLQNGGMVAGDDETASINVNPSSNKVTLTAQSLANFETRLELGSDGIRLLAYDEGGNWVELKLDLVNNGISINGTQIDLNRFLSDYGI